MYRIVPLSTNAPSCSDTPAFLMIPYCALVHLKHHDLSDYKYYILYSISGFIVGTCKEVVELSKNHGSDPRRCNKPSQLGAAKVAVAVLLVLDGSLFWFLFLEGQIGFQLRPTGLGTRIYIYIYMLTYILAYIYIYIYIHIHTHTQTHAHTHKYNIVQYNIDSIK